MVALLGGVCWGLAMSWRVTIMVVRAGMVWWVGDVMRLLLDGVGLDDAAVGAERPVNVRAAAGC